MHNNLPAVEAPRPDTFTIKFTEFTPACLRHWRAVAEAAARDDTDRIVIEWNRLLAAMSRELRLVSPLSLMDCGEMH